MSCGARSTPGRAPTAGSRPRRPRPPYPTRSTGLSAGEVGRPLAPGEPAGLPQHAAGAAGQLGGVRRGGQDQRAIAGRRSRGSARASSGGQAGVGGVGADPVLVASDEAGLAGRHAGRPDDVPAEVEDRRADSGSGSFRSIVTTGCAVEVGHREVADPLPSRAACRTPGTTVRCGAPAGAGSRCRTPRCIKRVLVLGVHGGSPRGCCPAPGHAVVRREDLAGDLRCRSSRTIPLTFSSRPISTLGVLAPHLDRRASRPGRHVDLVDEHVAVEDALWVTAVGRDHDRDVRVRADPLVARPRSARRPRGHGQLRARSRPAGRRSPRPPAGEDVVELRSARASRRRSTW